MQPSNTYNSVYNVQPIANVKSSYNTTYSANVVPINNQSSFVDETFNTYRRNNNLMPDYMKKDLSKNSKIEKLKDNTGTEICTPQDLDYIRKTFRIVPHKDKSQILGKTGIKLSFNPQSKTFILQK